jgi:imidazolonepropionase-like amidohydrolase
MAKMKVSLIRNVQYRPAPNLAARWVEVEITGDTITAIRDLPTGTQPPQSDVRQSPSVAQDGSVDGKGAFLIPGLINLHTHLFRKVRAKDPAARITDAVTMTVRALRNGHDYLAEGVTTVRDLGAPMDLDIALSELESMGQVVAPRIVACGRPLTETGGHNHDFGVVVDGPDALRQAVRARIQAGAGFIKLMASLGGTRYFQKNHTQLPSLDTAEAWAMVDEIVARADPDKPYRMTERDGYTVEELTAAADEARRQGWRTCAHAVTAQSLINCVEAGLTTVEHGTFMSREAAARIADSATIYVPTVSTSFNRVVYGRADGWPDYLLRWAVFVAEPWFASVRLAADMGLPVAVGTDAGGDMFMEMQLIHRAGYSAHEVLLGATERAAQVLGRDDLGRVAVGAKADLVLLPGDPLEDFEVLQTPALTIKAGQTFTRSDYQM